MTERARPSKIEDSNVTTTRRTQRDRRESTRAKLVDAAIASLLEVGYARSSVKEVCSRAGVSHGGLFRHFESMVDLMIAVGDEVASRQIRNAEAAFASVSEREQPLVAALHVLRDASRAPINVVFYELAVAARTDETLRAALSEFGKRYATAIFESAARMPGVDQLPPGMLPVVLSSAIHLFDGEALTRTIVALPELEDLRMQMLELVAVSLGGAGRRT